MNVNKLLSKGYFPKELPPPFETIKFANKAAIILKKWNKLLAKEKLPKIGENQQLAEKRFNENYNQKYRSSKCTTYNLAKGIYSRRKLEIPNPKQYYDLSLFLVDNWSDIKKIFRLSFFSASIPVEKDAKRAVRTKSRSLNEFQFQLIEKSFNKRYELRIDIAQFYPSIYTHSITWALMGKEDAKKYFRLSSKRRAALLATDPKAKIYTNADQLDTLLRNCQEMQSIGLPIGPDISFILAELIGSRVDNEIKKKLEAIKLGFECTRFYDDYYLYLDSYDDAEKALKIVQGQFTEFQLETNESKIKIKELPFSFEAEWVTNLSSFHFRVINKYEIRNYFSIIFELIQKYPSDSSWIIAYGLIRFEYGSVKISPEVWDIFLNLLLKTLLVDASNIDKIFKILLSYETYIKAKSKEKIAKILARIINEHLGLNQNFEVAWALWICKSFKIKCNSRLLNKIFTSDDDISKLIGLDLLHNKCYTGRKPSKISLINNLRGTDLMNEKWLFTYESIKQGWLVPTTKVMEENAFLKILFDYNVSFYNVKNQILPEFDIKSKFNVTNKIQDEGEVDTDNKDAFSNFFKTLESKSPPVVIKY